MKKTFYAAFVFAAISLTSCGGEEVTETTNETEETQEITSESYELVNESSSLNWRGAWVVPGEDGQMMEVKNHVGTVNFNEGYAHVEGDAVTADFVIDMNSISNDDLAEDPEQKEKLENHLKDETFFKVEDFMAAKAHIKSIEGGMAHLVISVAGVEMENKVPVTTSTNGDEMTIEGEFTMDFSSLEMPMTMPNPEKLEDGHINPEFGFTVKAVFNKKA